MNSRVTLKGKQILIDGKPCFLRSVELQYFRLRRQDWADRIQAAKDGGQNCIASYIPWQWHEPERDLFDFTGKGLAERDLVSFLDLVRDSGLFFFARLGPFVNAELVRGGHPLWLFDTYPNLYSKDSSGRYAYRQNDGDPAPSQLNPDYLELVFKWYSQVAEVLKPYSIENGGPIILLQVDNEPNLVFTYGVEGSLYDEHVIKRGGLWEKWLESEYGSGIESRYGKKAGEGVEPPRTGKTTNLHEYRLVADWLRFKKWHIFEYLRRLAENVREQGLDLPFTMNEPVNKYWPWNSGDHASFSLFMENNNVSMFPNGHCYFNYGGEQNLNGVPVTLARLESVKMSRIAGPPSIYELGSWYYLSSSTLGSYNWDIMVKLLIGSGMNGYSIYVYNDGETAPGFGRIGSSYNWHTVIGFDGTRNQRYSVLSQINTFVECWETEILKGEKLFDVTIGLPNELPMIAENLELPEEAPKDFSPVPLNLTELSRDVSRSVTDLCRVLTHLSVNFEFMSLDHPNRLPGKQTKLLIVPNNGSVTEKAASFIEAHLSSGGNVVFYPFVPTVDGDGNRLQRLAELTGQRITGALSRGGQAVGDMVYRIIKGETEQEIGLDSPFIYFDVPQGSSVLASLNKKSIAYRTVVGGGYATVMGFLPVFFTLATQQLYDDLLLKANGLRRTVFSADGSVFATARGSEGGPVLLTAATIQGDDASTRLHLQQGGDELILPVSGNLEMKAKEARFLWTNLPLPEGKLLYTTSQVVRGDSPGEYLASGAPGTAGQMAFGRSIRASIGGRERKLVQEADSWILTYEHGKDPVSITLKP